jgi:hypothetical protein
MAADVMPALPPGFEIDPPPPPGFEPDSQIAPRQPVAGLRPPARAEIPGVDPQWAAGQAPAQLEVQRRAQVARDNPISERVVGAVEGALDIIAKLGGGSIGGMLGLAAAPFSDATAEQSMATGAQRGVEAVRGAYGLAGLNVADGPQTATGDMLSGGFDKAMEALPPVVGTFGTLAGPAMNAGAAARQVAAPVARVARQGLDVAGSAVERGTAAVQGLRRPAAAAEATPGTPGSAGAAGLDMATQRRERAKNLPVPFEGDAALTEGQATRTFEQQRFERETAKDPDMGGRLRERAAEQNAVALRNLDALEEFTGATKTERGAAGQVVVDAIAKKADDAKTEIRAAYDEARAAGDMAEPVSADPLARWIEENRSSAGNAGVINTAEAELLRLGGAQKAGDGSLVPREITINDLEELRKKIVAGGKKDPTNAYFAAQINRVIDDATENRGGELYKAARTKFRGYQQEFKERGAIRDLIGVKKGTSDSITAVEKVLDRAMRSTDDLKNVRETLITAGEGGAQAWREVQGQAMRRLRDEVTKGVATDIRGNPIVSPAKLKQTVSKWDADGRLEVLFGKKGAETLRDLSDVSTDLFTAPPGSVNTSNTASVVAKYLADSAASFVATGVPLPLVSLTKAAWKARSDRKVKKQVDAALGPKGEATPSGAPPRNPLEGSDRLPEGATPPKPPAPEKIPVGQAKELAPEAAAALTPSKRERDLLKLRENVTDPEIQKDLDRAITAERKRAAEEARGQEYLKLADQTSDPELRAGFEARAEKLGVVRTKDEPIPAGEATEVDVQTVEARGLAAPEPATQTAPPLPPNEQAIWAKKWGFGDLDAQTARDVREARRYDADAVEQAAQQNERSPVAFGRAIQRIIEEGKARESQAKPPAGGSEGPGSPGGGLRRQDGGPGQEDGGTPVSPVRGGPRAPNSPSGGGSQARPDAEGLAQPAPSAGSPRFQDLAGRVGKIDDQKGLTDVERWIERRFGDAVRADPDAFLARYEKLKDTRGGKIVNTDEARELWHEYSVSNDARALYARAAHEPASWIAKAQWDKLISEPPKTRRAMLLGGGGGSGKTSSLEGIEPGFEKRFDAIYDTTLASEPRAIKVIEQALQSGRTVDIVFTAREPLDAIINGIIKRATVKGRTVPLERAVEAHIEAPKILQSLRERFLDEERVKFRFVDNTRGPNEQRLVEPRDLPEFDYNDLLGRALRATADAYEQGSISEAVFRGLTGEAGREGPARLRERLAGSSDANAGAKPASQYRQGRGPRQEVASVASAPAGRLTSALTEAGTEIKTRYRLMEAGDLVTSHDNALRANPAYDQVLQPRDRARQASEDQIARIANDIRPELLGESPKASEGAPIIGGDAQVESGNARTIALRRAYDAGNAKRYRLWLIDSAEDFGLTAEQVRGLKQPVLVRQGLGDYDRAEFARQANESTVAEMSATERARADARSMNDLEGLNFDEAGNIDTSQSADWLRSYIQNTIGPNKRGEVMTADGSLSQSGNTRIRNAVLMKAYNDTALVERVAESLDPGTKNVLNGLSRAAPDVAKLQDMAAAGAREAPTWVPDLVDAVRRFSDAREAGQSVQQYLGQGSLLGGEASPAVAALMQQIEAFSRAPRRLADHIRALVRESMKDPRQGELMEPRAIYKVSTQTDTPEFKRWFGDSKVVDADGKPLVVYHGTTNDFSVFGQSADMGYHFGSAKVASKRITDLADNRELRGPDRIRGAQVMPAHLSIKNPLHMGADHGDWRFVRVYRELMRRGIITKERFEKAKDQRADEFYRLRDQGGVADPSEQADAFMMRELRNDLEALGYDGISYLNEVEGVGKTAADRKANPDNLSWIAFRPEQIKSATGNRGAFDPADANITREPEPLLRPQTPADLKAKTEREAAALKADQAEQKRLADKARADAMAAEFTLTGSDRAADNPNQGSLFEPRPLPATSPYETDLFGAPVVQPAQRARPRRAGLQPPTASGRNVDAAAGLSGAPPGNYATRAALVATRQQQLGHAGPVKSLADAAHALAYLNKSAVERFDALVTDKDGNPLAVIGGFKGALSQAAVYPATLLGEAMQVPKAANLWMSHNHPSGATALSAADENLASNIASAFDGTGIKVRGIIAAGADKWGGATPMRDGSVVFDDRISDRPLQPAQGSTVPAQERQLVESGKLGPAIQSPADAKALVRKLVHENAYRPTIILLDSQHAPVAAVPWSVDDAMPLRGNGKLDRLLRAVASSNAGAALIGTGDGRTGGRVLSMDQAQNIGAALAKADVRVLDIIDANGGSAAEKGLNTRAAVLRSVGAGGAALAIGGLAQQNQDETDNDL